MKKVLILAGLFAFVLGSSGLCATVNAKQDPKVMAAVDKYKNGNYVGCIQDMEALVAKDPSNALAHYYSAISYVKIGDREKAITSYNNVLGLNSTDTLNEYAKKGVACLESPGSCSNETSTLGDLETFINNKSNFSQDSQKLLKQLELEKIKNNMNQEVKNLQNKSEAIDYNKVSENPSNDEIVWALKTLQKSGINPYPANNAGAANIQGGEMSQLSMLMGGQNQNNNSGNNFNNMLPYLLSAQQNGQKINPEAMKTMMMSSMMPDFSAFDTKQQDF